MSGIFSIAYSGLNAFQRALSVAGNNLVNGRTPGYSRQSIHFVTNPTQRFGNSYQGNGVGIAGVTRSSDHFINTEVRSAISVKSQYDNFFNQASQIDKLLSQDGTSISASLQSFFDSLSQLNDAPASLSSRKVVLTQAKLLSSQFNTMQQKLDDYQHNSTQQIGETLNQLNLLTKDIASLNEAILARPEDLGLLDQRDELIDRLSQFTQVSVLPQQDNTLTVSLTGGDMLVAGAHSRNLYLGPANGNHFGTKIYIGENGPQSEITSHLSGGSLGGLLDYEQNVLGRANQLIGQLAIGLSQKFNAQHQLGMDMNNLLGTNFFTDFNTQAFQLDRVMSSSTNTGNAILSVSITDISQTQLSDYNLTVTDIANNELRAIRVSDGKSVSLQLTSNPPAPPAGAFTLDGMTITVDDISHLANADSFRLMPTRNAARFLNVDIEDAKQIAFASPITTLPGSSNQGSGQIALGAILNTNAVANQYRIHFITPTQYQVDNLTDSTTSGPFNFVPNTSNTLQIPDATNPSYSVVLSGLPEAGDEFYSQYNTGGVTDNRNGLSLFGLQQSKFLAGNSASLFDAYAGLLGDVGSQVNQASIRAQSAQVLYDSATDVKQSQSGVNEDEELANILYLKKAYEAAGKLLEVTSSMIDTLFQLLR